MKTDTTWTYDSCNDDGTPYFLQRPRTDAERESDYQKLFDPTGDEEVFGRHLPGYLLQGTPSKEQITRLLMYASRPESLIPVLTYRSPEQTP